MYRVALLAVLLLLPACASSRGPVTSAPRARPPLTLCIDMQAAGYGTATVRAGLTSWRGVGNGPTACKEVPEEVGGIRVSVVTIGGGALGPLQWRDLLQPGGFRCWTLTIRSPAIATTLLPCSDQADPMGWTGEPTMIRIDPRWLGFTTCLDGEEQASAWVNLRHLADSEWAPTIAHEIQHAASIEADGGCTRHRARRAADPRGVALDMEAAAFCASARTWAGQNGHRLEVGVQKYAVWLYGYGFGLSLSEAADEIRSRCNPA